jgi:antitoxin HicB
LPPGEGEGYVITFPDLPGCVAKGATQEQAIENARGEFHAWMASIIEDHKRIPAPHSAAADDHAPEALSVKQRARIRANSRARGMTFEVLLPESLADWLRKKIADGVYTDATEAAYLAFQDLRGLDRHPEVRRDLLGAMINDALKEPVETFTIEEVRSKLRALRREYADDDPLSQV